MPVTFPEPATHAQIFVERNQHDHDEGLTAELAARFREYDGAAPSFRTLRARTKLLEDHKDLLYRLYDSKSATAVAVKRAVHEVARLRCPYCGSPGYPSTLDHFLPRSEFQEFSLYPKNLIPSCPDCNTAKRANVWDETGNRNYINPYYDDFLRSAFVEVAVKPDPADGSFETPLFEFNFGLAGLTPDQVRTCQSHFSLLSITDRLREQFASKLRVFRRRFRGEVMSGTLERQTVLESLEREESAHTEEHGPNCWEALFSRAVASNGALIDYICRVPIISSPPIH